MTQNRIEDNTLCDTTNPISSNWDFHLSEISRLKQTATQYCREKGLNVANFYGYKSKKRQKSKKKKYLTHIKTQERQSQKSKPFQKVSVLKASVSAQSSTEKIRFILPHHFVIECSIKDVPALYKILQEHEI